MDRSEHAPPLNKKRILLGITAGIAAYKTPMLVRALRAAGADVQVVMSANAHRFVGKTALQAVSGNVVRDSLWDEAAEASMGHIELARWADLVVIAPATANCIADLAHGRAGDLLSTLCLATTAPVLIAPAMNQQMYQHAATQANLVAIENLGYRLIGPASGEQACGEEGPGRMTEPDDIASAITELLCDTSDAGTLSTPDVAALPIDAATPSPDTLRGVTALVTAGPTKEAIDPVRFISNHSSGRQGLAIASSLAANGARVILVAGPGVEPCEADMERIDVVSAVDMQAAVMSRVQEIDLFIGVAAVADYRPGTPARQKLKRSGEAGATQTIELVENPDIIAGVAAVRPKPVVIGFAAETNDTLEHARAKRLRKGLDAIVLNDVSDPSIGFNPQMNAATFIYHEGEIELPRQSKRSLADAIVAQVASIYAHQLVPASSKSVRK